MIVAMARTPGGGRSPSTRPPPLLPRPGSGNHPSPNGRPRSSPRSASVSVVRWGVLIGGIVIIADLAAQAMAQRTASPDDIAAIFDADDFINYVLFSILGVIVVRDTGIFYLGAIAGVLASLIDGIVVATAASLAPPQGEPLLLDQYFARNLTIGILFAGLSGVVYFVVQRWSGTRRSR